MTPTATQARFTPATMPSRTPALAWPSASEYRQRIEEEIAPRLRSKGATDIEIAREVVAEAAKRQKSDAKLREAHKDLEAFFVGMLLTEMKKSVKKTSGLTDGGRGEEIFEKMMTEQQSKAIANRGDGLGIATMLDQAHLRRMINIRPGTEGWSNGIPALQQAEAAKRAWEASNSTELDGMTPMAADPTDEARMAAVRSEARAAYARVAGTTK